MATFSFRLAVKDNDNVVTEYRTSEEYMEYFWLAISQSAFLMVRPEYHLASALIEMCKGDKCKPEAALVKACEEYVAFWDTHDKEE